MEWTSKVGEAVNKAVNSNKVLNVVLLGAFGFLCVRSVQQQRNIQVLETEKDSFLNSNKAMKKAMWDWKQQLFAEADLPNPLLPLSKLKSIYGEVQTAPTSSGGDAQKGDGKSPASAFVV
ncbi:uncharacterized protein LOC107762618 [Nicotiana tabacum]|uniref:Uncharacterized protein LOC107762618 n=1 Tax=Nicotiana tabacum TaxID=4097 RepID=A0A1S3X9N4_TOBAC|nr:uncharacterized protein LOC104120803 [Nicotiana tomentosiformis]XP_016436473.1 PREDICTED: uncharacterized protein LOC107762618 [Nicotiana tabacum]